MDVVLLRQGLPKFELKATGGKTVQVEARQVVGLTVEASGIRKEDADGVRAE